VLLQLAELQTHQLAYFLPSESFLAKNVPATPTHVEQ
jgi:hypothetical protein